MESGQFRSALSDFDYLWDRRGELHPHKVALIAMYSTAAVRGMAKAPQDALMGRMQERIDYAKQVFGSLQKSTPHFDLEAKIEKIAALKRNKKVSFDKIDFVTVE